jgi:propionyl-CoA carboxylase alpha chain
VLTRCRVRLHGSLIGVSSADGQSTFARLAEDATAEAGHPTGECRATLPGSVARVLVAVGDPVEEGTGLVVLEAMKMDHTLRAAGPGRVREIRVRPGQQVDVGDVLVVAEPSG